MREIKFRAWIEAYNFTDEETGELIKIEAHMDYNLQVGQRTIYTDEFLNDGNKIVKDRIRLNKAFSIIKNLMQYTGLKDKNDKEIYHSDLIRDDAGYLWKVESGYDGFYLLTQEKDIRPDRRICERVKYLEIIGNIYENKDALL